MSIEEAKNLIHTLANSLQAAMGYMELGHYDKARIAVKSCAVLLRQLSHALGALAAAAQIEAEKAAEDAAKAQQLASTAKDLADDAADKAAHIKEVLDSAQDALKRMKK